MADRRNQTANLRLAMLSPISWRTPPHHYGPWEYVVSLLTEELVRMGVDITLFATGDSQTAGNLQWISELPYSQAHDIDPKVWECLHIAKLFEQADEFDLIHNQFDFLPLSYSRLVSTPLVTTIHGFSSAAILPVYERYGDRSCYVAISEADKHPRLNYAATIHHGIDTSCFPFQPNAGDYLLFFGRIHHDKGVREAIEVARRTGIKLVIAGIVHDEHYYDAEVRPFVDGKTVEYIGPVTAENKADVLGGALALLHLINFDEPFGLSLVEAMACGTPVVAFCRGSIPEIIRDGQTGFVTSDVDGAVDAVAQLTSISRRACRDHVQTHFTAERMARDYLHVYNSVLARRENYRPWGHYDNLSEAGDHKVKTIVVDPGKQLSLQKHAHRAEHWIVVRGSALATVNDRPVPLSVGQSIDIPRGSVHRMANPGDEPLVFVEVQTGDYFGEDDIVRLEDDFGRVDAG